MNTPVSLTSGSLTNKTEVFIEYWLIDYGSTMTAVRICPKMFPDAGEDAGGTRGRLYPEHSRCGDSQCLIADH